MPEVIPAFVGNFQLNETKPKPLGLAARSKDIDCWYLYHVELPIRGQAVYFKNYTVAQPLAYGRTCL